MGGYVFSPFPQCFDNSQKKLRIIYCNEFIDHHYSQKASFVKQFCIISNFEIVLRCSWMCNR